MEKTLGLAGQQLLFGAPDDDQYLSTMPPNGPSDVQSIFELFCDDGFNVIDVGANIGVTAAIASILVRSGMVVALEPVPDVFSHLEANMARSHLDNVKCRNVACGAENGHLTMVSRSGHGFAAFVGFDGVLERYSHYTESPIAAVTLDSLFAQEQLDHVDFIKIDVEGYELEVLRGGRGLLSTFCPTVFLEANHYCLNIFRRISLVDFLEEILTMFPVVVAVDTSSQIIDLTDLSTHSDFFHANVVMGRFPNLLCGFTSVVLEKAHQLSLRVAGDAPPESAIARTDTSNGPLGGRRHLAGVRRKPKRRGQ